MRLTVNASELRVGDVILSCACNGSYSKWYSAKVALGHKYYDPGVLLRAYPPPNFVFEVDRDSLSVPGASVAPSGPAKAVADWPLKCPRCGRADAAVMLFSSMDCRWGCFARGTR